ncbi:NAD-dependent epimerase/dehydratase family protein [Pirellulaceae bacterium SH449]
MSECLVRMVRLDGIGNGIFSLDLVLFRESLTIAMRFRKALVTGATGFIGSNLVKHLRSSVDVVYGFSRSETGDKKLIETGVVPIRFDLEKPEQVQFPGEIREGLDVVFHLAGKLAGTLDSMLQVNEKGTERLLQVLSEHHCRPIFVALSSIAAAGPARLGEARRESDSPQPVSDYGRSKLAGERVAASYADKFPVSIVRPGIVYGSGDKEFIRLLQSMKRLYLNPMIGRGQSPLSFIEVGELVQLLLLVADRGERVQAANDDGDSIDGKGVYNASTEDALSLRDLGRLFSSTLNCPVLSIPFPKTVGFGLGFAGEIFSSVTKTPLTLTRDKIREASAASWQVNSEKAVEQLGWQRSRTEDSLRNWILQALELGLL